MLPGQTNTIIRCRLLVRFLAKIVSKKFILNLVTALIARAGMDFSKIRVKLAENRPKISHLCEGWHQFLKKLGILVKMLHKWLV